ncbi:uncharacterized protein LOC143291234 [Babylonia areolata]|uniref:uncharacterized protein LOC143291234 n=1 Tax=Babylonia areolata TaxID=304850 RepID=UPI003FD5E8C2
MQSRKSIPNVGRRAQGRKTLFMLKGSGVTSPGCPPSALHAPGQTSSRTRPPLTWVSLSAGGEEGDGRPPVTHDEAMLSQPTHPYNRIIQRILRRHRAAQGGEVQEQTSSLVTLRAERHLSQETAATSAPPHSRHAHTLPAHPSHSKTRVPPTKPEESGLHSRLEGEGEGEENEPHLQWADILSADHSADDPHDLQSALSSPDDQSLCSLDLAKGYLTHRGLFTDHSQDGGVQDGAGALDTTRSEPPSLSSPPSLARKRDLQPLDDVLDYFWVYQGMSRQLLHPHSPSQHWSNKWFHKKPTKLPPLYIATGQKNEATSSERTGSNSVQSSRRSSKDVDTPGGTPRERKVTTEHRCEQRSQCSRTSLASDHCQVSEARVDNDVDSVVDNHGGVGSIRDALPSEEGGEKEQGRRVTLVVKMPALTRESSASDFLDYE